MKPTALIIGAIIALLAYILGRKACRFFVYLRQFNKLPGPHYPIPFLSIAYIFSKIPKECHLRWSQSIAKRFKDRLFAVWIGPIGVVAIQNPEHIEVVLRSNEQITKAMLYDVSLAWVGKGLVTSTGSKWSHNRKMINPSFHFSILEEFAEVMIEKGAIMNSCIERHIEKHGNKPLDIFEYGLKCALDIIGETAMGVDLHAQESFGNEYLNAVHVLGRTMYNRVFRPWLIPDWIFYRTSSGKAFTVAVKLAQDLCTRVIEQKKQEHRSTPKSINPAVDEKTSELGKRKRKVFIDLLLEANQKDEDPLTIEEIRDQINTFMFAGHDTTGALIGWAMFCLGNEPDVQKKIHEELDENLGHLDDEAITKQLPNLKYLDRVIKEVLRLYPSVPIVARRITEDLPMGDHIVPKNATLAILIHNLHREASVWPEPLRFDPDRFLPANVKNRHPYAYIPFSAGPRNCIGYKYAFLEAKIVLVKLLQKFSVKSVENHSTIKMYTELVLSPIGGLYVNMTKRSTKV